MDVHCPAPSGPGPSILASLPLAVACALLLLSGPVAGKGSDWDDSVVGQAGAPVTLPCSAQLGNRTVHWHWQPAGWDSWSLVLSANHKQEFWGGARKLEQRLADPSFPSSGDLSLAFRARQQDSGQYLCEVDTKEGEMKPKRHIVLLVILTVSVGPPSPVPAGGTARLLARVSAEDWRGGVSWFSPQGVPLPRETLPSGGVLSKVPRFGPADQGNYTCQVLPQGPCGRPRFLFSHAVVLRDSTQDPFTNVSHGLSQSLVSSSLSPLSLPCLWSPGADYFQLRWRLPDSRKTQLVFLFDRWRQSTENRRPARLRLAHPDPFRSGNYSFLLTPKPGDAGRYTCEVFLDESAYQKSLSLTVVHVSGQPSGQGLLLSCLYRERPPVRRAYWTSQSSPLNGSSTAPGQVSAEVPRHRPGNYSCCLELKDGRTHAAVYALPPPPPPPAGDSSLYSSSVYPALAVAGVLSLLLALAAAVVLWKRGICQQHTAREEPPCAVEGENLYENPDDLRKDWDQRGEFVPPTAVYMELNPDGQDVYKELERYEECHQ
ncbi:g6f-like isoform X1 [Lepisosteus oculatus]|uniref:g6f-like isoform X1 n=1 Tax=Lepisosteus oculatus TaxID=7918 RepID=UPI003714AFA5